MKKMTDVIRVPSALLLLALVLSSCSSDSGTFRFEGRLRNINQGELWVYSTDGAFEGIDTIQVRSGRFSHEWPLDAASTLVVIFPNYSEQPVFAKPGSTVELKGDASHLKEMTIGGTQENKQMTQLRMELNRLTPPEIPHAVEKFIREHTQSPVSIYLLWRFFVLSPEADHKKAYQLAKLLSKDMPDNLQLAALRSRLAKLQGGALRDKLPRFSATDIKGKKVTNSLLTGKVAVVSAWATWSYRSQDQQRRIKKLHQQYGGRLALISICLDGRTAACSRAVKNDSLPGAVVCDGQMWQSPLLAKFGLADVPGNIVVDASGRVVARNLPSKELEERVAQLLK